MAQIIVVEDDVYMREELIDVLEKAGYDAVPLLDFENAVSQIMSLSPDLILLDINLPFHSGFEICKEVKAKQLGTVLILTARDVLPDGVGLYQYDGETLLAFPVHVALGAAEPIEAKNPLIILVDKPAQSLKASSCMLPLTSSGNVLFAEGEKLQESFDESKLIDYGSIEEFQMNH